VLTKIKKEKALEKLEEYSKIVDKLIKIGHKQGEELRESLNLKIRALVRNAFDDGQQKVQDFDAYVNSYIISAGVQKSDREEQEDYERRLRDTRTYICINKHQLNLELSSFNESKIPFFFFIVNIKSLFLNHFLDF
jgi:hypothetical protein